MNKADFSKICKVCSDKALGFNFNAITCESCKAFFRRNAHKLDKLQCPFENNCKVDIITRRYCQKCRLVKCFEVGMIKDSILNDKQKHLKREKIHINKLKKMNDKGKVNLFNGKTILKDNIFGENNTNNENLLTSSLHYTENCELQSYIPQIYEQIIASSIFPFSYNDNYNLNELEKTKICEIVYFAEKFILKPVINRAPRKETILEDLTTITDACIRNFIKWSKKITTFRNLCIDDQISLLKGGCTEMLIMKSFLNFNSESEEWQLEETNHKIKLDWFKEIKTSLHEAHRKFMNSLDKRWRHDVTAVVIMLVIILFTPERTNLRHPEAIRLEQYSYIYLLRRYIESVCHSREEARSILLHLLIIIKGLHALSNNHIQIYMELDPHLIGPLLVEILDLNH